MCVHTCYCSLHKPISQTLGLACEPLCMCSPSPCNYWPRPHREPAPPPRHSRSLPHPHRYKRRHSNHLKQLLLRESSHHHHVSGCGHVVMCLRQDRLYNIIFMACLKLKCIIIHGTLPLTLCDARYTLPHTVWCTVHSPPHCVMCDVWCVGGVISDLVHYVYFWV